MIFIILRKHHQVELGDKKINMFAKPGSFFSKHLEALPIFSWKLEWEQIIFGINSICM